MAASTARISSDVAEQMARVNDLFNTEVIGNRNFGPLDQIYTTDARILPPGAPMIFGREAIRDFWRNMVESMSPKSAVLTSIDVMPAGDGAVEIGKAVITIAPETTMEVKYVVYWRPESGSWKWHVDIWNHS